MVKINVHYLPTSGIEAAAGGVLSARSNSRTKNATNTHMPAQQREIEKFVYSLITA